MERFAARCLLGTRWRDTMFGDTMFGEMCSFGLMRELGIDADSVRRCALARTEVVLRQQLEEQAWSPSAVRVNGWRFAGDPSPDQVFRAACSGLVHAPSQCETHETSETSGTLSFRDVVDAALTLGNLTLAILDKAAALHSLHTSKHEVKQSRGPKPGPLRTPDVQDLAPHVQGLASQPSSEPSLPSTPATTAVTDRPFTTAPGMDANHQGSVQKPWRLDSHSMLPFAIGASLGLLAILSFAGGWLLGFLRDARSRGLDASSEMSVYDLHQDA
ncbi:VSR7 [Symbiodinium natans]|uniref:VSR7 protein n=1 Tax=Symbiodinium natans TaxID=878477 RepID=A0A812MF14_9DINO|nr:VSR7 [Symbiodinium natans]